MICWAPHGQYLYTRPDGTLAVRGATPSAGKSAIVTMRPLAPQTDFTALPDIVKPGERVLLDGSKIKYASRCRAGAHWHWDWSMRATRITPGVDIFAIYPIGTSIYVWTCWGPGGSYKKARGVIVEMDPPSDSAAFAVDPDIIEPGETVLLRWSVAENSRCSVTGAAVAPDGKSASPTHSGFYTLKCSNHSGSVDITRGMIVQAPPLSVSLGVSPDVIRPGREEVKVEWDVRNADQCVFNRTITIPTVPPTIIGAGSPIFIEGWGIVDSAGPGFYILTCSNHNGLLNITRAVVMRDFVDNHPPPAPTIIGAVPGYEWQNRDFTVLIEFPADEPQLIEYNGELVLVAASGLGAREYKAGVSCWLNVGWWGAHIRTAHRMVWCSEFIGVAPDGRQTWRHWHSLMCDRQGRGECRVEARSIDRAMNMSEPPNPFEYYNIDWTRPRIPIPRWWW